MSYFPMFIDLEGRRCLIVGGGKVALRKAEALREFGSRLTVVAPRILLQLKQMRGVAWAEKRFEAQDLAGQDLVVAATDDKEENHRIAKLCRERKIPVNAVDQTEDCDFIFPAYLKQGEVVAAFSSGGQSPVTAQHLKEGIRPMMTPLLGEISSCLGSLRERVMGCVDTQEGRKRLYQELLALALEEERIPSKEEIEEALHRHGKAGSAERERARTKKEEDAAADMRI